MISGSFLDAQTIAHPDSADVVRNKVKVVRIYFKMADGKRDQQLQLHYDKQGRVIIERQNESTYYYEYAYDKKGRKISSTQRTKDGVLIQKFVEEHNEKDSSRKVSLFSSGDTLKPTTVYVYNKHGWKIREEQHNSLGVAYVYGFAYDAKGTLITTYDSIGYQQTASLRKNGLLTWRRVYSPQGQLLHEYRYAYTPQGQITDVWDSTGLIPVVHYQVKYNPNAQIEKMLRDTTVMSALESEHFRNDFFYVFPYRDGENESNGLPHPGLVNEHNFTRDKKGNIIRDDLVQKMGSFSQTYVYEYEYEFY